MKMFRRMLAAGCAVAICALVPVLAQDDPGPIPQSDDPPGRAATLSYVSGMVSLQPGGVDDWGPATLNRPMTTGDRLVDGSGARAELDLGTAAVRLNGRTNFTFVNLNDTTAQIQISSGTASVRLRRLDPNEVFEIDTPHAAFTLDRAGEYRVEVSEAGDATMLSARSGQGEALTTDNRNVPVDQRSQVRISGSPDSALTVDTRNIPVADAFDNFCMDRDRRVDNSESAQYLSRDIPGYADLDGQGTWNEDPDYGRVWAPRVEAGWAPYQNGHWAWISPWGWTWVDDAPWGYAPFHYGRWAYARGGWVWAPGPVVVRPVYSPAMVAWGRRVRLQRRGGGGRRSGCGMVPSCAG